MLSTLLSSNINPQEKKEILEDKYDIKMSKDLESEVGGMCNLSDTIYDNGKEQGIEIGKEQGIEIGKEQGELNATYKFVQSKKLTLQDAAESLGITIEQLITDMKKAGCNLSQ